MKPKNVIVWILLLGIVVLTMSTSVQAKELTEVNATDILKQIENGENIYLENVRIKGELNLSKMVLETVTYAGFKFNLMGTERELKIVESEIKIKNSVFEDDVDFSNTQFRKDIDFSGTSFSSKNDFTFANFAGGADFGNANFAGGADFENANFTGDADFFDASFAGHSSFKFVIFAGDADFFDADFSGDAYFGFANFAGDADFMGANFAGHPYFNFVNFADKAHFWFANFAGDAYFGNANFAGGAYFGNATFTGDAYFTVANFAGDAYFTVANFAGDAYFENANFAGDAYFENANFAGDADFFDADFSGDANFESADFTGDADFRDANFAGDAIFGSTEFDKVSFTKTSFTNVYLNESGFNQMYVEWSTLKDALVFDGHTYIKIIKNFREMEVFEDADAAYYQYRQLSQASKKWSSKLINVVAGASCGYGVKPWNAAALAVAIILIFIPIYGLRGGIRRSKENDEKDEEDVSSRRKTWNAFVDAFYFSMVTFTTIGYGDLYPADRYRKVAVMIEGLLGWLILALFLVTLANVMIRP